MSPEVEVLAGRHGELIWQVLVSGTAENLMTMIHVRSGDRVVAASGFGGPSLYPDRLVAVTDRGTEVELAMSEPVPGFGLRFGAAGLPDGEAPGRLVAWRDGAVVEDTATPMPPSPPFRGAGWSPPSG